MCRQFGLDWAIPCPARQQDVTEIIYGQIKQGHRANMAQFHAAADDLRQQGCDMAVLGCTELSLVKRDEHLGRFFLDSTEVLCEASLRACGVDPIGFDDLKG